MDWDEMRDSVLWQGHWRQVQAFVMVLCYSRLLYVEFSVGTRLLDFLRCHHNGLCFLGSTPRDCVYANLSSVVTRRQGTVHDWMRGFDNACYLVYTVYCMNF